MISAFVASVPLLVVATWFFLTKVPDSTDAGELRVMNTVIVLVALVLSAANALLLYLTVGQAMPEAPWKSLALLGALFIVPIVLFLGVAMRWRRALH